MMFDKEMIESISKLKTYEELSLFLIKNCIDYFSPCSICKHEVECLGKDCPNYESGIGGYLGDKYVNYKWSCQDFNYGECERLINTPCYKCIDENFKNFKLKFKMN